MRRRRFFRFPRRGGGQPLQRQQPLWTTALFNESAIDVTGGAPATELNIFDVQTLAEGNTATGPSERFKVKRIICKGDVAFVSQQAVATFDIVHLLGAIYVIDRDDSDNVINATAQGNILEGGADRLLWTNSWSWTAAEVPTAQYGEAYWPAPARIDVDLKVNVRIGYDQVLVLGLQYFGAVNTAISVSAYSGIHRCLFVKP